MTDRQPDPTDASDEEQSFDVPYLTLMNEDARSAGTVAGISATFPTVAFPAFRRLRLPLFPVVPRTDVDEPHGQPDDDQAGEENHDSGKIEHIVRIVV